MGFVFGLVIVGALVTLGIMITGAVSMAKGGDFNKKYGNRLMRYRVLAQAITILLLLVVAYSVSP